MEGEKGSGGEHCNRGIRIKSSSNSVSSLLGRFILRLRFQFDSNWTVVHDMHLHVSPEFPIPNLLGLVFDPQRVQEFIVQLLGRHSLHVIVKVRLVALQSMVQCELADTQNLQLLVQNTFAPTFSFVFKKAQVEYLSNTKIECLGKLGTSMHH